MNHHASKEKVEAVLEVMVGEGLDAKTSFIYASRIGNGGSWRYERNNGKKFPIMRMDPEKISHKMVEASKGKGHTHYQVHYFWRPKDGSEREGIIIYKK